MQRSTTFVPIRQAAAELGVPLSWLRAEAEASHVPALLAGRQWLVNLQQTKRVLCRRARTEAVVKGQEVTT